MRTSYCFLITGDTFLYEIKTINDTNTPFNKLNGTVDKSTNASKPLILGLIAVPIAINASNGIFMKNEYAGRMIK